VQWENGYGDWAPQELGRWALWNTKRPFVIRTPCHRRDSTTVVKMPFLVCGPWSIAGCSMESAEFRTRASRARGWWARAQSARARCDFIRIIFNTYMYCIIFSRSARFVFCFFRRGTEENFGGDRAELCPSPFAVEPEVQSIIENFNSRTFILFYSIGLHFKENGYREARGCYDAGEWTREWFHDRRWNGWRSSFVKHWNQLVQEKSKLCEEVNSLFPVYYKECRTALQKCQQWCLLWQGRLW